MITRSITHNLRNLARFSGRDRPGQFWPYAIAVFVIGSLAMAVGLLMLILTAVRRAHAFANAISGDATIAAGPNFGAMMIGVGVAAALIVALLAAGATRRLHDTDRTGLWSLVPVVFLVFGLLGMAYFFSNVPPSRALFLLLFVNNLVYLGSLGVLIVFLIFTGTPGDNRYGPPASA